MSRLSVAIDLTPLLSARTGIGLSVAGMWAALEAMNDGPRLKPYALGLRNGTPGPDVPQSLRRVRTPARLAVESWQRYEHPKIDRWLGDVDVLHTTNYVTPPSRHPTVMTVNDLSFVYQPSPDRVVATFPGMLRRAVARGAHIHVTTRQVAGEVDDVFGPGLVDAGRISVVAFGIPPVGASPPADPRIKRLIGGRPYVLFIGTDEPRKNLPRLVEAFGHLAPDVPELLLVLAGRQTGHSALTTDAIAALRPEVASRVLRLGVVSDDARSNLLGGARAMAYPSTYEGFGFPILEAMRAGVPVVGSDVAVLREVAGDAAVLADPLDGAALAEAIRKAVFDGPVRQGLIDAGARRAASFTWDATAVGLDALYKKAASDAAL